MTSDTHPCTPDHDCAEHDADHLHHPHGDHCDHHGPVETAQQA
jgi:hypothetical protein